MIAQHTSTCFQSNSVKDADERSQCSLDSAPMRVDFVKTSLGLALVAATAKGLRAVLLGNSRSALLSDLRRRFPRSELLDRDATHRCLTERVGLFVDDTGTDLPVELDMAGTEFEKRVWDAIRDISVGSTASYSDIARIVGLPATAQTVAAACSANHLAIVVPCHRVVRKDGTLAGYRWAVARKQDLLAKERALTNPPDGIPLIKNCQLVLRLFEMEQQPVN